jgi:hypothetical protein
VAETFESRHSKASPKLLNRLRGPRKASSYRFQPLLSQASGICSHSPLRYLSTGVYCCACSVRFAINRVSESRFPPKSETLHQEHIQRSKELWVAIRSGDTETFASFSRFERGEPWIKCDSVYIFLSEVAETR